MATHQETRETDSPEVQVTFWQSTDMHLQVLRHVVVMVALVTEGTQ